MQEVTILQMLEAREKRADLQKQLISIYKTPLICFTMNIAGPYKTSPIIERAFLEGMQLLKENFKKDIVHSESKISVTGCEAMLCVSSESQKVKDICVKIEESHPLGRLFDMDVLGVNGAKLERRNLRGCIVCGKEGRECAAGRLHSVEELQQATNTIIDDYFVRKDSEYIGNLATECLLQEVYTTPKPGLVDRNNNGSHKDMNMALFEKSAKCLTPYFCRCFEIGYKNKNQSFEQIFSMLRKAGIGAEKDMFEVTEGVNTHKGAIFSLGVICGAVGMLWNAENLCPDTQEILSLCGKLTKNAMQKDFLSTDNSTAGIKAYKEYKISGVRGEVASGFLSVKNISLPIYQHALAQGYSKNDAGAIALIHLISSVEDTTVYSRGGKDGADFAKKSAKDLIKNTAFPSIAEIERLDREFIARNLSAGGCADLLAVTYFLSNFK